MNIPNEVFNMFEKFAVEIREQGFTRYSSDAILHRIRWHYNIEIGNRSFKANNDWTPVLARWLIAKRPEFAGFFELRVRTVFDAEAIKALEQSIRENERAA